jgi:hypothetical protein
MPLAGDDATLSYKMCAKCREYGRKKNRVHRADEKQKSQGETQPRVIAPLERPEGQWAAAVGSQAVGGNSRPEPALERKEKRKADDVTMLQAGPKAKIAKTSTLAKHSVLKEYQTEAECLAAIRGGSLRTFEGSFAIVADPTISHERRAQLVHRSLLSILRWASVPVL